MCLRFMMNKLLLLLLLPFNMPSDKSIKTFVFEALKPGLHYHRVIVAFVPTLSANQNLRDNFWHILTLQADLQAENCAQMNA